MRKKLSGLFVLSLTLAPVAVHAQTWRHEAEGYVSSIVNIAFFAALAWALVSLVWAGKALWRVILGPREDAPQTRREAGIEAIKRVVWGLVPFLLINRLRLTDQFIDQLPSLLIGALWAAALLPALLIPAQKKSARLVRMINLALADVLALLLIYWRVIGTEYSLNFITLGAFALILHLTVIFSLAALGQAHVKTRWALLVMVLFFGSSFVLTPALAADRLKLNGQTIFEVGDLNEQINGAALEQDGTRAFVLFDRTPRKLFFVDLESGHRQAIFNSTQAHFEFFTLDPKRELILAPTKKMFEKRMYLFTATPFIPRGRYQGGESFTALTAAVEGNYLVVGGEGANANFRICRVLDGRGGDDWPIAQSCRELLLPIKRVGNVLLLSSRNLAVLTEGKKDFARGYQAMVIELNGGRVLYSADLGRGLGQMAYDELMGMIYFARPETGTIEVRFSDKLALQETIPLEPGVDFITIDNRRRLLLAASSYTGRFVIYNMETKKILSRVAIGSGIKSMDYSAEHGLTLFNAKRGLVAVKTFDLPGMPLPY
ncbi:MAG TPA: hypothetical protein PKW95_06695 [bacterium]|nr:hypothetical protein [bacterium]